jgi:hypothetical protein
MTFDMYSDVNGVYHLGGMRPIVFPSFSMRWSLYIKAGSGDGNRTVTLFHSVGPPVIGFAAYKHEYRRK